MRGVRLDVVRSAGFVMNAPWFALYVDESHVGAALLCAIYARKYSVETAAGSVIVKSVTNVFAKNVAE